jgi:hypothetical protein
MLNRSGKLTMSKPRFSDLSVASAYGMTVVSNRTQTRLLGLHAARSKPKLLAKTHRK